MKVKSEREVAQSCPTPSDPMDYSSPGSSVHRIFQARVLEWGAILHTKYISICVGIADSREGNGTPLQYSCLENPMDGGAWWAAVHEVTKSWTRLSDFPFTFHFHALETEMATHSSVLT